MMEVSVRLQCTRKAGTLSRIIREIKLFGITYQKHKIENLEYVCILEVDAAGELNCQREQLESMFLTLPEVLKVDEIVIRRDGVELSGYRTGASETSIDALQGLTPAVLLAAEKRISEILGPVSSFLVEKAAKNSTNVGQLYLRLASELDSQKERDDFLLVVRNLKKSR